jgi:hypothetical protein
MGFVGRMVPLFIFSTNPGLLTMMASMLEYMEDTNAVKRFWEIRLFLNPKENTLSGQMSWVQMEVLFRNMRFTKKSGTASVSAPT